MIRQATKFDRDQVVAMLNRYKLVSPLKFQRTADPAQAYKIFDSIIAGAGICFVADEDGKLTGFLLAVRNVNVWVPDTWAIQELAYWVEPEHRGSTAGYRLLKSYTDYCQELLNQKQISYFTVSKMSNSPDLKYNRFGYEELESTWSVQECQQA